MTAVSEATELDGTRGAQPRQLIVTVYGLYSREEGGWLSVASLIGLLGVVGVDETAVRSSISRLKRRSILEAVRRGTTAGYQLSAAGLAILREGDERIFRRERATTADGWLLAVFSVPEAERNKRHLLRTQLAKMGFGTASSGVWIAPAHLHHATEDALTRLGLTAYADLFHADHLAFGDVAAKVREWWDLDRLDGLYTAFLDDHAPALRRWQRRKSVSNAASAGKSTSARPGRDAFADYVQVLTAWRRLPYLDPGLPAELLPKNWSGIRAADVFFALHSLLEAPARAYVAEAIGHAGYCADRY